MTVEMAIPMSPTYQSPMYHKYNWEMICVSGVLSSIASSFVQEAVINMDIVAVNLSVFHYHFRCTVTRGEML